MRQGIIGYIALLIGLAVFALIFIFTQTKVIQRGEDAKMEEQKAQDQINLIQNQLNEQNKKIEDLNH